jgi:hypothetical protein
MQINYLGKGEFEIKTKNAVVYAGEQTKIGQFILPGEGEYEVAEVQVQVIDSIQVFNIEGMNLAYIGKKKSLKDKEAEEINGVDILLLPIGGGDYFDPKQALNAISQIEPKIVIPMQYESVDEFIKAGSLHPETLDSLKIVKSQIGEEDQKKVIILNAKN